MIEELATAYAKTQSAAPNCLCETLPHLKQLTRADRLRLAAKLEQLAAIMRICANCEPESILRPGKHCPLRQPLRRN